MRYLYGVISVLLVLLSIRYYFFYVYQPVYQDGQHFSFQTTLFSEPAYIGNTQRVKVTLETGTSIVIIIPQYPELHYGDRIDVSGILKKREFENRVRLYMYFPDIMLQTNTFFYPLAFIRQRIQSVFHQSLSPIHSSLLLGIVFGITEGMPDTFYHNLKNSGVLHIVAASGMNVALVAGFLAGFFTLGMKRQYAMVCAIGGIVLYAIIAGLQASIIRASGMGILLFVARIIGKQYLASYGLFLAVWAMLIMWPYYIFDIGFQLSVMATIGILYLQPLFQKHTLFKNNLIGQDLASTFSAQITTLPIMLGNFGVYSLWSVVANVLVLWTIGPLMILGGIAAVLGSISIPVGKLVAFVAIPLLWYLESVVNWFGSFEGMQIPLFTSFFATLGYYLLIVSLIIVFTRKRRRE